jgi:hypothetical protein
VDPIQGRNPALNLSSHHVTGAAPPQGQASDSRSVDRHSVDDAQPRRQMSTAQFRLVGNHQSDPVAGFNPITTHDHQNIKITLFGDILKKGAPYKDDEQKKNCGMTLGNLLDKVDKHLSTSKMITNNSAGTQKKTMCFHMLKNTVGPAPSLEARRTLGRSLTHTDLVQHLTKEAEAEYKVLREKNKLRELKDPFSCMVVVALHVYLKDKGYALSDLVLIASKPYNFGGVLILASHIMNQDPFKSESGGGNHVDAGPPSLSSIAGHVKIASYVGAYNTFCAIHVHFTTLGFTREHIFSMACRDNAANMIEAVAQHDRTLLDRGFNNDQIVQIAMRSSAVALFKMIPKYADAVLKNGCDPADIVKIVTRHKPLEQIESDLKRLAGPSRDDEEFLKAFEELLGGGSGMLTEAGSTVDDGASDGESMEWEPIPFGAQAADPELGAQEADPEDQEAQDYRMLAEAGLADRPTAEELLAEDSDSDLGWESVEAWWVEQLMAERGQMHRQ